jgi:uncharacterized protein
MSGRESDRRIEQLQVPSGPDFARRVNMKLCFAVAVLSLIGPASLGAQSAPASGIKTPSPGSKQPAASTAPSPAGKIDPAKEADIRRLLDLVGTRDLVVQSMDAMSKSIKPLLTNSLPPGEYREKLVNLFFEKFTTKSNVQHLLDMAVPIYDKNFSHEEIRSLMAFYQTPLGKKTASTLPRLSAELQEEGRKWGESLGRESMQEVLAEHPDLEQALVAAQKTPADK